MAYLTKLHEAEAEIAAPNSDPWRLPLERVRGKAGDDGIERVTSQMLFDILDVPQRSRGAGACRRLAKIMVRDLTRGGYLEQVRGYARDARRHSAASN